MYAEQVGEIVVIFVKEIIVASWLKDKPCLDFHELFAYLLVWFRENRKAFLVIDERVY